MITIDESLKKRFHMGTHEKITETCYYHSLCGNDFKRTSNFIKVSQATIRKYVKIGNCLDISLQEKMDQKGKHKLSLTLANILASEVNDLDFQCIIFENMCKDNLTNREKIDKINDYSECTICCDNTFKQIMLPCSSSVCITCLYKHIQTSINDIVFEGCKCPITNDYLSEIFIYQILTINLMGNPYKWIRNTHIYQKKHYYRNLFRKYRAIVENIEDKQNKKINQKTNDFSELIDSELYYGTCKECCPIIDNKANRVFFNLKVNTVERQCVNAEGNIVVLNNGMFKCESCIGGENEYKKCPHCGIKTLKPAGCNYVICGDHRWCWICNERLPNNHNGHNVHYWTGPGTSPYSNQCRRSISYPGEDFVINFCECISCSSYGGKRICNTLTCYNRCDSQYCEECVK